MSYDREQRQVIAAINQIARQRGVPRRHLLAALEIGAVESGFRNLRGGDRDSAGWRQERAQFYKDPTNLRASINRVFDEMAKADTGQHVGDLAQAVQRSGFPGRYAQHLGEARRLAGGGSEGPTGQPGQVLPGRRPRLIPGSPETVDNKAAMLAAVTDPRKNMSLLDRFNEQVRSGNYTTAATAPRVVPGRPARFAVGTSGAQGGGDLGSIKARADAIDRRHLPYLWGGGHGADTSGPLDCSGAVSKLLGINPRVASQFMKWGKPGRDPKGGLTVYANPGHVLVEIGGHFWGTSRSNPGGGAGWIPRSQISQAYLSRFTARHI